MATGELKTDFTRSIGDANNQYRFDRQLTFPSGALVHFAVSKGEVWVVTGPSGENTVLLP